MAAEWLTRPYASFAAATAKLRNSTTQRTLRHDHPLHSGAREQGICRRSPIQHAAIEQPPEDVLTLAPAVEPVAELIEVGLQVPGADPMEDVKRPALEVGEHDVRPG